MNLLARPAHRVRDFLLLLLCLTPAISYAVVLYSRGNHFHLASDGGEYLLGAQSSYLRWFHGSAWSFIKSLYFDRMYKGTLHTVLAVPFFFLTNGNPASAALLYATATCLLLGWACLRILRLFMDQAPATLSCLVLMTLPWILRTGPRFYSDLPATAFFISGVATIWESLLLKRPKLAWQSLFWFSVSTCIRPVEGIFNLAMFFLGLLATEKFAASRSPEIQFPGFWKLGALGLGVILITLAWYAPVDTAYYLGSLRRPFDPSQEFGRSAGPIYSHFLGTSFLVLFLIVLPLVGKKIQTVRLWASSVAFTIIAHPLWGFMTINRETRYYKTSAVLLWTTVLLFLFGALRGYKRRLVFGLLIGIIGINICFSFSDSFPSSALKNFRESFWPQFQTDEVWEDIEQDHSAELFPFLQKNLAASRSPKVFFGNHMTVTLYDLQLRARQLELPWTLDYGPEYNGPLESVLKPYDFILLGPVLKDQDAILEPFGSENLTTVYKSWRAKHLADLGYAEKDALYVWHQNWGFVLFERIVK